MKPTLFQSGLLSLGIAACGGQPVGNTAHPEQRACTPPREHWIQQTSLDSGLSVPEVHLSVDRNARLYWNGYPSDLRQVSTNLSVISHLSTTPVVFLETEMGASCALVDRVRDEMETKLDCRNGGPCAEGIWKVWQETPSPTGVPPS